MTSHAHGYVVRPMRTATWNYIRGDETASAYAMCRPDRRWFVSIDAWDEEAYAPLVAAMREDLRHDLYMNVSGDDQEGLRRWQEFGGLARALLASAFTPLHERGVTHISAEADATNVASIHLLESIGAVRTDETLELIWRNER